MAPLSKGEDDVNKKELYRIATDPTGALEERYEAVRLLQQRRASDEDIAKIIRFYPVLTPGEIAERIGTHHFFVEYIARKFGLKKAAEGEKNERKSSKRKQHTYTK